MNVRTYIDRQLQSAANAVVLAMDGKIRRHDAVLCAKAVLLDMGFKRAVPPVELIVPGSDYYGEHRPFEPQSETITHGG
jgi:hypothetical protein